MLNKILNDLEVFQPRTREALTAIATGQVPHHHRFKRRGIRRGRQCPFLYL